MPALDGRLALVTGASSGIGAAVARALAAEGATLVLAARRRERLLEVAADCPGATVVELDVRDADAVRDALEPFAFDVVVNNAGLALGMEAIASGDVREWDVVIDTNLKGVLHVTRATLPAMLERGSGDLVLIGSVAARQVFPSGGVYCATKHATRALYETLRLESAGKGVRFSTVDPGMVRSEFSLVRLRGNEKFDRALYKGVAPLEVEDVAEAVRFVVTRPKHVNVGEVVLWPTCQASATVLHRR